VLIAGHRLGAYEIVAPLGAGGMGEVYRARDTRLERTVAIKILPAHLSADPELKQRLEREAKAISSLNHPHICTLYDVGAQDGTDFLVMEYLEGETLAQRLHKGALPVEEAVAVAITVANALEKAHRQGILHRDLKPGNVMLTKNGPKLMDFGLAKAIAAGGVATAAVAGLTPSTPTLSLAALSSPAGPLTEKGTVVGTFQYMAPEVLQGKDADASADVFSFGCMLYEMLTGRRAFEGKSQFSVLGAILDREPERIATLQPNCPAHLEETVRCCLAKNPDQRYRCMHDVAIQLESVAQMPPPQAMAQKLSSGNTRLPWLAAGVAVLVALVAVGAYWNLAVKPAPVVRSSILPPPGTTFLTISALAGSPVLSPDGTRLAFTARDEKGKVMLYNRLLASLTAQPLTGTDDAVYPFWSPDGREIAFFVAGKLKRIDANGGPPQTLCDAPQGRGGSWNPQGVIVFSPGPATALLRVSAAGGVPEPASKLDVTKGENSHRWPYFLPDGQHFLFWARSSHGLQEAVLYVGSLGLLDAKPLMKSESMAVYVPDYLLFMRDQTLMAQPFSARRLETTGPPMPVAEHVFINAGTNRPIFSASNNSTLVYQTGNTQGGWHLLWYTRDGKQTGVLADLDRYFDPAISPDGTQLAASLFSPLGTADIWVFDLLRGTKTRLTFGPSIQRYPIWSADGKTIFYGSNGTGQMHIYAKAADGSGGVQTVLESSGIVEMPEAVSPDHRHLVFTRVTADRQMLADIWALPLVGERKPFPVVQTEFNDFNPVVSPDGKWMAYANSESGRYEVYITAFPAGGAKWQVSTGGGLAPKWRHDGKELFFLDPGDNFVAVDVDSSATTVRLGAPHALFHALGVQVPQGPYAVTADGKKLLVNTSDVKEMTEPLTMVQNWPAELKR